MIYRYIILVFAALVCHNVFAQKLNWAFTLGGEGQDIVGGGAVDTEDNAYVVGEFQRSASLGGSTNLPVFTTDSSIRYLAKYDVNGNNIHLFLLENWVDVHIGPKDGAIYIIGNFYKTQDLDPTEGVFNVSPGHDSTTYIAKISKHGKFHWAKVFKKGTQLLINNSNYLYLYYNQGLERVLCKLDSNAAPIWSKVIIRYKVQMVCRDCAADFTSDTHGDIYIRDCFEYCDTSGVDFDPSERVSHLYSRDANSYFVRYDSAGNLIHARTLPSEIYVSGRPNLMSLKHAVVDKNGNNYFTTLFRDYARIDTSKNAPLFYAEGGTDVLLVKYNNKGDLKWVRQVKGLGEEGNVSVSLHMPSQKLIMTGIAGTAHLQSSSDTFVPFYCESSACSYLALYDTLGTLEWVKNIGQKYYDIPFVSDKKLYITGAYNNSINTDLENNSFILQSNGSVDGYLASYDWSAMTGLGNVSIASESIKAYPNPTSKRLTLQFETISQGQIILLKADGMLVGRLPFEGSYAHLEVDDLASGLYIVQISTSETVITLKFYKE